MKTTFLAMLLALLMAPWASAIQDETKQEDASMTAHKAILDAYNEKVNAARKLRREKRNEIRTREAFQKFMDEHYPKAAPTAKLMMGVVEKFPRSAGALESLKWVLQHDRESGAKTALPHLERDFAGDENIGSICGTIGRQGSLEGKNFLNKVLDTNKSETARGQACFALAGWYRGHIRNLKYLNSDDKEYAASISKRIGKSMVDHIQTAGKEGLEKEALKYYRRAAKDFANVEVPRRGKIGAMAQGAITKLTRLRIGGEAPDIVGKDVDGVAFKLSDYRGKVVVVDFWGDW